MTATIGVTLRPAEVVEQDAVQDLWEACGLGRAAPDEWAALLAGDTSAVLVAEEGGVIVGSAIASFDGWRAYVYHVAVHPDRRREGVARALLEEAEHYLLSAGARYVFVAVHEANTDGLALVASEGYLPEGEIVFAKRLASRV